MMILRVMFFLADVLQRCLSSLFGFLASLRDELRIPGPEQDWCLAEKNMVFFLGRARENVIFARFYKGFR